jgi:hypothetical protein
MSAPLPLIRRNGTAPDEVVQEGLYVHLDAADPFSYPGQGMIWHDLKGNHDGELPGEASHPLADPHWNGRAFVFKGFNFIRLLGSQSGYFKTWSKEGAVYTVDCCFRTGPTIGNPHFLLADNAHGNPFGGCGFSFYFYNFYNTRLRHSVQNNGLTKLTRSVHCTHPIDLLPNTSYRAALVVDSRSGRGHVALDDHVMDFDATYVGATTKDSPYYVNIGAPGNIEFNVEAQWDRHVSQLQFVVENLKTRFETTPYGRMRFNPKFELFNMLVYDRALELDELDHNFAFFKHRHLLG